MSEERTRVVIFVPPGPREVRHWRDCLEHMRRRHRGAVLAGVAHDVESLLRMWVAGEADVVVVARPAHRDMLVHAVEVVTDVQWRQTRRTRRTRRV